MSCWEVKDYLLQLVDFKEDENELVLPLCRSSLKEIEAMLKADANRSDVRIVAAAAALAYYKLLVRRSNIESPDEISSFKAGDVSITKGSTNDNIQLKIDKAEKYYHSMIEKIIPLCQDNNFSFRQVEVMKP